MDHAAFLCSIGFDENMIAQYAALAPLEEAMLPIVRQYAADTLTLPQALELAGGKGPSEYGAYLAFLVCCACQMRDRFFPEDYLPAMADLTAKARECLAVKGELGIFVPQWYDGFFQGTRIAFRRLQFDMLPQCGLLLSVNGFALQPEDFALRCHIPSGQPLTLQACVQDLHCAWERFRPRLRQDVLPVLCDSWLLYPAFLPLFGEESNLGIFQRSFHIYEARSQEGFADAWRVFSQPLTQDLGSLPQNTRLQRSFVQYLSQGGSCGTGSGLLLFDGNRILTAS